VERDRGSVELAAAVVRQNNAVSTEVDGEPGIGDRLDALDEEFARAPAKSYFSRSAGV